MQGSREVKQAFGAIQKGGDPERVMRAVRTLRRLGWPDGRIYQKAGSALQLSGIKYDPEGQHLSLPRMEGPVAAPDSLSERARSLTDNVLKRLMEPIVDSRAISYRLQEYGGAGPHAKHPALLKSYVRRGQTPERIQAFVRLPALTGAMLGHATHEGDHGSYQSAGEELGCRAFRLLGCEVPELKRLQTAPSYHLAVQPKGEEVLPVVWRTQSLAAATQEDLRLHRPEFRLCRVQREIELREVAAFAIEESELPLFVEDDIALDNELRQPLPASDVESFVRAGDADILAPIATAVMARQILSVQPDSRS